MGTNFSEKINRMAIFLICCCMILGSIKSQGVVFARENTSGKTIYVKNGQESSEVGAGTVDNPYESLKHAISQAEDGDTIKLTEKVVFRNSGDFEINKAITIDGENHILNFVGADISLGKNVTFKNMELKMIHETNRVPKIYVNGNELNIENVTTKISDIQNDVRPMIIAGDRNGNPSGIHPKINISGGSSETRFNKILVGNENGDLYIPADVTINSQFAVVDDGIILGGDTNQATEKVTVISNSTGIKKIDGTNSINNEVILKDNKFYSLSLDNIVDLTLKNNAEITVDSQKAFSGTVELNENTKLVVNGSNQFNVGVLKGEGMVTLKPDTSLNAKKTIEGTIHIELQATEDKLIDKVSKVYVNAEERIEAGVVASIDPVSDEYYLDRKENTFVLYKEKSVEITVTEPKLGGVPSFNPIENLPENVIEMASYWTHKNEKETFMTSSNDEINKTLRERGVNPVSFNETGEYKYKVLFTINAQNRDKFKKAFEGLKVNINGVPHELILDEEKLVASVEVIYNLVAETTDADRNNPKGKNVEVEVGENPEASEGILNKEELPENTTFEWKEVPNTETSGVKQAIIVVRYPDNSSEEVPVNVIVKEPQVLPEPTDADRNNPKGKNVEVEVGGNPEASEGILNKEELPENTIFEWKEAPNTEASGVKQAIIVVRYPDNSSEEVPVNVIVKEPQVLPEPTDADRNNPKGKNVEVEVGENPEASEGILNKEELPENTIFEWKEAPNTEASGVKQAIIVVRYPDNSSEEVPVNVIVKEPQVLPETPETPNTPEAPEVPETPEKSEITKPQNTKEVKKSDNVSKEVKVTSTKNSSTIKNPRTGDFGIAMSLLISAMAGLGLVGTKKRKK